MFMSSHHSCSHAQNNTVWMGRTSESFDKMMLWAASLTALSHFHAGETMVSSEDSYNPNSQSPYSNTAVNDAKASLIISLQIKQSKMDQERVVRRVLIGKTGDNIYLINSLFAYLSRRGNNPGPLFQW